MILTIKSTIRSCFFMLLLLPCLLTTSVKAATFLFQAQLWLPSLEAHEGDQSSSWTHCNFYYDKENLLIQTLSEQKVMQVTLEDVIGLKVLQGQSNLVYFERKESQQRARSRLCIETVKVSFASNETRKSAIETLHQLLYPNDGSLHEVSGSSMIDYMLLPVVNTTDENATKASERLKAHLELLPFHSQGALEFAVDKVSAKNEFFYKTVQHHVDKPIKPNTLISRYVFLNIGELPIGQMTSAITVALSTRHTAVLAQSYFINMGSEFFGYYAYSRPEEMLYAAVQFIKRRCHPPADGRE